MSLLPHFPDSPEMPRSVFHHRGPNWPIIFLLLGIAAFWGGVAYLSLG